MKVFLCAGGRGRGREEGGKSSNLGMKIDKSKRRNSSKPGVVKLTIVAAMSEDWHNIETKYFGLEGRQKKSTPFGLNVQ